jgi:putative addiction module component (TIGR02574 family)
VIQDQIPEITALSPSDKLALVVELWDELSAHPDDLPVSEEQLAELDRRHAAYQANPETVVSWEEVRSRLKSRL